MREGETAVGLQWAKQGIGVDLIPWSGEETATVIAAQGLRRGSP
jgi:hypothetical protein